MNQIMTASDLYARSQGRANDGPEECHWCGSKCGRGWPHGEPPLDVGQKRVVYAKRPGARFTCEGCWLWGRRRISVTGLTGAITDGQCPLNHSWLVTRESSFALGKLSMCGALLYQRLLRPPLKFFLSLKDGPGENLLQLALLNSFEKIEMDTRLAFTLNGTPHYYTVYELEEGLTHGPEGKEPGVQALIRLMGPRPKPPEEEVKISPPKVGRPKALEDAKALKRQVGRGKD